MNSFYFIWLFNKVKLLVSGIKKYLNLYKNMYIDIRFFFLLRLGQNEQVQTYLKIIKSDQTTASIKVRISIIIIRKYPIVSGANKAMTIEKDSYQAMCFLLG